MELAKIYVRLAHSLLFVRMHGVFIPLRSNLCLWQESACLYANKMFAHIFVILEKLLVYCLAMFSQDSRLNSKLAQRTPKRRWGIPR